MYKKTMALALTIAMVVTLLAGISPASVADAPYSGAYQLFDFQSESHIGDIVKNGWLNAQTTVGDYTATRLWKLHISSDPRTTNRYPRFMTYGLQIANYFAAFKLKCNAGGKSALTVIHKKAAGGGIGNVYLLPADTAADVDVISALLTDENKVGSVDFYDANEETADVTDPNHYTCLGDIEVPASGEVMIVLQKASNNTYWTGIELNGAIPTSATLTYPSAYASVGANSGLLPTITPYDGANAIPSTSSASVAYSSLNPGIATVDAATGEITGITAGNATIRATLTLNGATVTADATLEVLPKPNKAYEIDFAADYTGGDRNITQDAALQIDTYAIYADGRDWYPINYDYQIVSRDFGLRMLTDKNQYVAYKIRLPYYEGFYSASVVYQQLSNDAGGSVGTDYGKGVAYILPGDTATADIPTAIASISTQGAIDCYGDGVTVKSVESALGDLVMTSDTANNGDYVEYIAVFKATATGGGDPTTGSGKNYRLTATKLVFDGIDPNYREPDPIVATDGRVRVSAANDSASGAAVAADITSASGTPSVTLGTSATHSVGTEFSLTAPLTVGDLVFRYWKNVGTNRVLSYNTAYTFTLGASTYITAVYGKVSTGDVIEFFNRNGAIVGSVELAESDTSFVTPSLPFAIGYGASTGWSSDEGATVYAGGATVARENAVRAFVARYNDPTADAISITVSGSTDDGVKTASYNELVTVTAGTAPESQVFRCWKRNGEVVSFNSTYSFYAWDNATLTAEFGTAIAPYAIAMLDTIKTDGANRCFMAEYSLPNDDCKLIERGIIYGGATGVTLDSYTAKYVSATTESNQFAAYAEGAVENMNYIRAYIIYKDAEGVYRIAYGNERSAS